MAEYSIYFRESVEKDLRVIPKKDLKKILRRIDLLVTEPRPAGCEKLIGQERYRVRQVRYRIVYSIQDIGKTVWIAKVGQRNMFAAKADMH